MKWITAQLASLWLPLMIAPLVTLATQVTKRASSWIDMQHPFVKQGVAAAYAAAFSALAAAVGTEICVDGAAFCAPVLLDWRVIFTWAGGIALHRTIRAPKGR
jgi:hypothetical protein